MHAASMNGHLDVLRALNGWNADLHATNVYGSNAVHIAAYEGQLDVVRTLKFWGVDVFAGDEHGRTPLWFAQEHPEVYQQLKEWGVEEEIISSSSSWIAVVICVIVVSAAAYWTRRFKPKSLPKHMNADETAAKARPPSRSHPDSPQSPTATAAQPKTKAPRAKDSRKLRRERKAARARLRAEEEAEKAEEMEEERKRAERKNRLLLAQIADEEVERLASKGVLASGSGVRHSGPKPMRTPSKSLGTKKQIGSVASDDDGCAWCGMRGVQLKRCTCKLVSYCSRSPSVSLCYSPAYFVCAVALHFI